MDNKILQIYIYIEQKSNKNLIHKVLTLYVCFFTFSFCVCDFKIEARVYFNMNHIFTTKKKTIVKFSKKNICHIKICKIERSPLPVVARIVLVYLMLKVQPVKEYQTLLRYLIVDNFFTLVLNIQDLYICMIIVCLSKPHSCQRSNVKNIRKV